jgi:hypothetical protein
MNPCSLCPQDKNTKTLSHVRTHRTIFTRLAIFYCARIARAGIWRVFDWLLILLASGCFPAASFGMTAHNITLRLPVCMAVLFCVICAQTIHANAPTAEIYVSPAGADSNPGTKEMPFQTLVRARDEARSLKSKVNGDIVVFLRAGTYCVTEPLVFGVGDSGVDGHSVEYRAFDHETPVISGGVTVTNWVLDHGKIFKANLNWDRKLRGLYVNGKRATMTQADFKGQGAWGEFIVNGTEPWAETPGKTLDGIQFDSSQMPRFSQPEDVELLQHRVWNFLVMGVRDIDTQSNRTLVPPRWRGDAALKPMAFSPSATPLNC